MKKCLLFIFILFYYAILEAQTLQSPEQFLGYKAGAHFTPHYKILNYFDAVASAKPDMVKIEKYGETNEGRSLIVAFIALPENMQRLDAIRINNLRLAGMMKDGISPVIPDAPAIVWLSYNVHGNEPSSSEAAMLTLFALVDPDNAQTKEWLKNTIVIIDPCINPDGRDRYVNWFNTAVGTHFNADPQAREHDEPWPRGRTNHYYFDLNRDWAWQTQKESQARIKKYNEWLPQVHVDFHEQGYDAPYYFAPAAEPYHEVITQWQRDFQVQIGRNNAKYFDDHGWLYFTKEIFDLFYPSYGDTYPMYNGAIGMTYEQGGIEGGLGIKTNTDDTLTLADRAMHHFTTSMSTIEISAQNAGKLISEYRKFFDDNMNAAGMDYKTYVLTAKDANQLHAIADLLDANKIEYGNTTKLFKGYNYFTGKEENASDDTYQLAVSAYQPKGKLVKVLFEPKSSLSDSATYDITAWSVPYAYGVKAYGVKEKLEISPYTLKPPPANVQSGYGLLIPYTSLNAAKVLCCLLQQNVKLRFSQSPFIYNHKNYERGTLIVLKGNNVANWNEITNKVCAMFNVQADGVESGFMEKGPDFGSDAMKFIHSPKVALLTGREVSSEAAGEVWNFFDQSLNYPITQLNANDLEYLKLDNYNVLIMPDGYYSSISNKAVSDKLESYVKNGGKIIAMENGAASLSVLGWSGLKLKADKDDDDTTKSEPDYSLLKKYGESTRNYLTTFIPGAIYKTELDNTYPLAYGYPDFYYTLRQDKRLYEFLKSGWNVGIIKNTNYISGFVGSKLKPALKDGLLIGEKDYGRGNIVIFADNPLFRLFWQNGKLMFANAVFLVGQ